LSPRGALYSIEAKQAKEIAGLYDVIVVDPPWPMEKIERDERPNQSEFEYPKGCGGTPDGARTNAPRTR
jgi:hypothetical protein